MPRHHPAPHTTRRVWAYVSVRPQATIREMGRALGIGYATVAAALRCLRDVYGYIDYPDRSAGARVVRVPLRTTTTRSV